MQKIKEIFFSNRFKSFYWRTGMMVLAVIIGSILSNIDMLTPYLNPTTVTVLGLILGEISKAINNALSNQT
jgi:hypothetical protein